MRDGIGVNILGNNMRFETADLRQDLTVILVNIARHILIKHFKCKDTFTTGKAESGV